jgi:hypothetical protein
MTDHAAPEPQPCRIGVYCRSHGFIHGAEAEELRERLEDLLRTDGADRSDGIRRILDTVDARDSLAWHDVKEHLEASEQEETPEPPDDGLLRLGSDFIVAKAEIVGLTGNGSVIGYLPIALRSGLTVFPADTRKNRAALEAVLQENAQRAQSKPPDDALRHAASAVKKLLPPALLDEVLSYIDPLGTFEKALRSAVVTETPTQAPTEKITAASDAELFVSRCCALGAFDTDIVKHALEDQQRIRTELAPLSRRAEAAEADLREAVNILRGVAHGVIAIYDRVIPGTIEKARAFLASLDARTEKQK